MMRRIGYSGYDSLFDSGASCEPLRAGLMIWCMCCLSYSECMRRRRGPRKKASRFFGIRTSISSSTSRSSSSTTLSGMKLVSPSIHTTTIGVAYKLSTSFFNLVLQIQIAAMSSCRARSEGASPSSRTSSRSVVTKNRRSRSSLCSLPHICSGIRRRRT